MTSVESSSEKQAGPIAASSAAEPARPMPHHAPAPRQSAVGVAISDPSGEIAIPRPRRSPPASEPAAPHVERGHSHGIRLEEVSTPASASLFST